jgi:flagellar biosynthesis protein
MNDTSDMNDISKNHANSLVQDDGLGMESDCGSPSYAATGRKQAVAAALHHDPALSDLPRMIAAGRGKWAEQIMQIAFDRGIKVRQDASLAEMLAAIELDSPVPPEAIMAVAEILAYVYAHENGGLTPPSFEPSADQNAD